MLLAAMSVLLFAAAHAQAAPINVNTNVDELNSDGDCSLREAESSAKNDAATDACTAGSGADVINVSAGTYNLGSQLLIQDHEVTIDGAGQGSTVIDGSASGAFAVIWTVNPDDPVRIQDLTVRNGPGTGIQANHALTLDHVTATGNTGSGIGGGPLTITDSSINGNGGTGISGNGTVTNSTVNNNGDMGIHSGGGDTTITGSTISGNDEVGIASRASLNLTQSTVSNNTPDTGGTWGGGLSITAPTSKTLTTILDEATVTGNSALSGGGGGIANGAEGTGVSNLTITDSTISGNDANSGGGINSGGAGTTTIERSTISGNSATGAEGGGISYSGLNPGQAMTLTNTTVSGNDAVGQGGGIYDGATMSVSFSTVSGNTSDNVAGGLDIDGTNGVLNLKSTILANNTGPRDDCFGPVTSQGYNLIETSQCTIGGDTTGNVLGQDPLLAALTPAGGGDPANGVPAATHELQLGSVALDVGGSTCPTTDQRGTLRPQGLGCDMGAFEREAPPETTITSGPAEGSTIAASTPTFGFSSSEPGSSFQCSVDGGAFIPCSNPSAIGPLANGQHTLQVRAKDQENVLDPTPASRTFTVATPPPSNAFSLGMSGKVLQVSVSAPGKVDVVDAGAPLSASSAKKKRRQLLLNPSSASGGPPTIAVPLSLTKYANQQLRKKGKLTVSARITFTPQGGTARTQTSSLRVTGKKKK